MTNRTNWDAFIARLNKTKRGKLTHTMGSPASAQVTRCRLLARYTNIAAHTDGNVLTVQLKSR